MKTLVSCCSVDFSVKFSATQSTMTDSNLWAAMSGGIIVLILTRDVRDEVSGEVTLHFWVLKFSACTTKHQIYDINPPPAPNTQNASQNFPFFVKIFSDKVQNRGTHKTSRNVWFHLRSTYSKSYASSKSCSFIGLKIFPWSAPKVCSCSKVAAGMKTQSNWGPRTRNLVRAVVCADKLLQYLSTKPLFSIWSDFNDATKRKHWWYMTLSQSTNNLVKKPRVKRKI